MENPGQSWLSRNGTNDKEGALTALLVDLFDGDAAGLRQWVRLRLGKAIHDELPDSGSLGQLAFETMLAIQRHGRIDIALFQSLYELRPRRADRIRDVARLYGVGTSASRGILSDERPASPFLAGPAIERPEAFVGRGRQIDEILDALRHRQPVQILGESRMGKSSLLHRVARDLVPQDMPMAHVSARSMAGWSPRELVLAVADALGKRAAIERLLGSGLRTDGEAPLVLQALDTLTPCSLLLDDADALATQGHRFDRAFFDHCRALLQAHRLLWISASQRDLQGLFEETGLTSEFLNDARRVVIGQMSEHDADALVAVLGPRLAARARAQAAGFAYGLQWMGDALWRDGDVEAIDDHFANAMEQTFRSWWRLRTQADRDLLRRLVTPARADELSRQERTRARKLVSRGLLREHDGVFSLPGAAWRDFVCDVA
jgi:hypothetical protein